MLPLKGKEKMTVDGKKRWKQVVLRSVGAIFFGWAVVSALVLLLSLYGLSPDAAPVTALPSPKLMAVKFPDNEKMLNDTAAQLAHEGAVLSTVEPSAR
jgi:hypothetical protein